MIKKAVFRQWGGQVESCLHPDGLRDGLVDESVNVRQPQTVQHLLCFLCVRAEMPGNKGSVFSLSCV